MPETVSDTTRRYPRTMYGVEAASPKDPEYGKSTDAPIFWIRTGRRAGCCNGNCVRGRPCDCVPAIDPPDPVVKVTIDADEPPLRMTRWDWVILAVAAASLIGAGVFAFLSVTVPQ